MTLTDEYLEWLRRRGRATRTIKARRDILGRIDRDLPHGLSAATADELSAWLYRDTWSKGTRETYYGALRSFFVWANSPLDPRLDYDPSALLPRPETPRRLPRPISDAELRRILTRACEPYRTWSLFAAYAGLRCIEIARLDRCDVTADTITIHRGKGDRPGVVPTYPAIWAAVESMPPGPVAWTDQGDPADAQWISIRTALYYRRRLGMPGVGLHRLRHWYGTTAYRNTKDIRKTQELLRHSSPSTTALYTLITDEERAAAIRSLPDVTGTSQE